MHNVSAHQLPQKLPITTGTYHNLNCFGHVTYMLQTSIYIEYSLRSRAEDMTIIIVIINPSEEMRLESEWRHAWNRWAENLGILKNTSVGSRLWASRVGSLLGTSPVGCWMGTGRVGSRLGPCRRTVEVEFRPWRWEFWVSTVEASGKVFRVPTSEDERRSKTPLWVLFT